jgi:acetyl-CoA carboxylase biotin carboxyl carrier protein
VIEVMKLYTTIEAEAGGVVESILAEDGKLVAFDQPLFVIRAG